MIDRPTARVILLDPDDRVLLFKSEADSILDPDIPAGVVQPSVFWSTPGGGVEPGESFEDAALRELWEETGIGDAILGPVVMEREKVFLVRGESYAVRERIFLARTTVTEVSLDNLEDGERADYRGHRWWTAAELLETDETVFPDGLVARIGGIISEAGRVPDRRVIARPTARVMLLDADNRVLLFRCVRDHDLHPERPTDLAPPRVFWITPGGGVEPGESFAEAAARELWEETGIGEAEFGPVVFERASLVLRDEPIPRNEQIFVAWTGVTEVSLDNQEDGEGAGSDGFRWWTVGELLETDEVVYPEGFVARVREVVAEFGRLGRNVVPPAARG